MVSGVICGYQYIHSYPWGLNFSCITMHLRTYLKISIIITRQTVKAISALNDPGLICKLLLITVIFLLINSRAPGLFCSPPCKRTFINFTKPYTNFHDHRKISVAILGIATLRTCRVPRHAGVNNAHRLIG